MHDVTESCTFGVVEFQTYILVCVLRCVVVGSHISGIK